MPTLNPNTMTQQQAEPTIEMNRVIAEFMGWEFKEEQQGIHAYHNGVKQWIDTPAFLTKVLTGGFKYHSDWNALHAAWSKAYHKYQTLDRLRSNEFIQRYIRPMKQAMMTNLLEAHRILYEAINWYNESTNTVKL